MEISLSDFLVGAASEQPLLYSLKQSPAIQRVMGGTVAIGRALKHMDETQAERFLAEQEVKETLGSFKAVWDYAQEVKGFVALPIPLKITTPPSHAVIQELRDLGMYGEGQSAGRY